MHCCGIGHYKAYRSACAAPKPTRLGALLRLVQLDLQFVQCQATPKKDGMLGSACLVI